MPLLIAVTVFLTLIGIVIIITRRPDRRTRSRWATQVATRPQPEPILSTELTKPVWERMGAPLVSAAAARLAAFAPASMRQSARRRLQRAGHPWGLNAEIFLLLCLLSLLIGFVLAVVALRAPLLSHNLRLLAALGLGGAGLLAPGWMIDRIANKRGRQIRKALPNVIDLLVVSVEAGLGLDGAIAEIITRESGPLVDEFSHALTEIRLGKRRRDAWRSLGERVQIGDLSAFMAAICQSEELGSSISRVLRTHSDSLRIKRSLHVRELANKIPVKMLFPLVFCIFPSMFIVILGPGALTIMHTMGKLGGG